MQLHVKGMDRARQAAKSLKLNLDSWHFEKPLTWHQDTIALMLGHSDWKALLTSVAANRAPSPPDDTLDHDDLSSRRAYQAEALIKRAGQEAADRGLSTSILSKIADFVAPTGSPQAGTAYKTMTVEITEDGITIPFDIEHWSEDAILFWKDVPTVPEYADIAGVSDPDGVAVYLMMRQKPLRDARLVKYLEEAPDHSLCKMAVLASLARSIGRVDHAHHIISEAFNIGSYAWAPLARKRRRKHSPVIWWDEPETRPLLCVLYEKAMTDYALGTDHDLESSFRMLRAIRALNTSDPFGVANVIDDLFGMSSVPDGSLDYKYSLSNECAGVTLWGDREALATLHSAVTDICDNAEMLHGDNTVLGLAYDIRMAFSGKERSSSVKNEDGSQREVWGFDSLWPIILVQTRMLRLALSTYDIAPRYFNAIASLEETIEIALHEEFGETAETIWSFRSRLSAPNLTSKMNGRGAVFSFWKPSERRQMAAELIRSFSEGYEKADPKLPVAEFERLEKATWPTVEWTVQR